MKTNAKKTVERNVIEEFSPFHAILNSITKGFETKDASVIEPVYAYQVTFLQWDENQCAQNRKELFENVFIPMQDSKADQTLRFKPIEMVNYGETGYIASYFKHQSVDSTGKENSFYGKCVLFLVKNSDDQWQIRVDADSISSQEVWEKALEEINYITQ